MKSPSTKRLQLRNIIAGLAEGISDIQDPKEARALLLGGILVSLVANITDAQWRLIMLTAAVPCGRPGCRCHEVTNDTLQAMDALREDAKMEFQRRRAGNFSPR